MSKPVLWIVIPCYNEEQVLPITAPMFLQKITSLTEKGMISDKSRVLFVNDGSRDKTWELICGFAKQDAHFIGISQSRNRGHQNAVLAGLMEARANNCDITISIDCDGQDDINAMDEMVQKYLDGAEVVYGVRSRRDTDTFFKRFTAEGFYHLMNALGAVSYTHLDVYKRQFGVQSARDSQLKTLGRPHTARQARAAFAAARRAGFTNISGDIMLALPHYTQAEFDETLEDVYKRQLLNRAYSTMFSRVVSTPKIR